MNADVRTYGIGTMRIGAVLCLAACLTACGSGSAPVPQPSEHPVELGDAEVSQSAAEHAVIVHFDYGRTDWDPFFEFERAIQAAIEDAGVGEYDGNELAVDGSDGTMYMYGADADKLFEVVRPHLASTKLLRNVEVTLRYGEALDFSAREVKIRLGD